MLRQGLAQADEQSAVSFRLAEALASPMPPEPEKLRELSQLVGRMQRLLPEQGETLAEILSGKKGRLEDCEAIKQYGKVLAQTGSESAQRTIGLVLYFAGICAGVVHHGVCLTGLEPEAVGPSCRALAEKEWMPLTLIHLLTAGAARFSRARGTDKGS